MIGMLYLGAYTLYALMYFPIMLLWRRAFQTTRGKRLFMWVFALIWFLIPTADYIVGRIYFEYLCHSDQMGLKVYRTVDGVRGIEVKGGSGVAKAILERYDIDYIETGSRLASRRQHGGLTRYTLDKNNQLQWEEVHEPRSQYMRGEYHTELPLNIIRREWTVEDRKTGERLAENFSYSFLCGWASPHRCAHKCFLRNSFFDVFIEEVIGVSKKSRSEK